MNSIHHIALICILSFFGCTERTDKGKVLAEVYGEKLYSSELDKVISPDATFEDSVFMVKEYVNVWLSKQVLLHQAEQVLSLEQKDKSKQLEQYKN
ncbi:MAG: hypothetical protein KJP21_06370, partial [Bacteroidia bacterium]|nr:hypothetical protein [Bacteroidia bacterium]